MGEMHLLTFCVCRHTNPVSHALLSVRCKTLVSLSGSQKKQKPRKQLQVTMLYMVNRYNMMHFTAQFLVVRAWSSASTCQQSSPDVAVCVL